MIGLFWLLKIGTISIDVANFDKPLQFQQQFLSRSSLRYFKLNLSFFLIAWNILHFEINSSSIYGFDICYLLRSHFKVFN